MRKIIGITGLQGSGKDSIGDILVKHYGFLKMSFAAHLKDVASLLFFMDRKMLAGETPEDRKIREEPDKFWSAKLGYDFTPRCALQMLGTDLLRNRFSENIWVDCLERKIADTDKDVVITDVRFPNEIDMIHNNGGIIWRIEKPEVPEWFRKIEKANLRTGYVFNHKGHVESFDDLPSNAEPGDVYFTATYDSYYWDGKKWVDTLKVTEKEADDITYFVPEVRNVHESEWRWIGVDKPEHIFKTMPTLEELEKEVLAYTGEKW